MAQPTTQTCKYNHTVQTANAQRTILAAHLSQLNMAKWYCLNPELYNSKKNMPTTNNASFEIGSPFPSAKPFPIAQVFDNLARHSRSPLLEGAG